MAKGNIQEIACEIQKMIIAEPVDTSPSLLWQQILAVCGQTQNSELSAIDFELYSRLAGDQLAGIVATQHFPNDLAFLYFGLYDILGTDGFTSPSRVGFYFAGGEDHNCEDAIENGNLSYLPAKRQLHLDVFDRIKEEGLKERKVYEWQLLFAAAAVLAKCAVSRLGLQLPTFVGFDSGDYFRIK